MGKKAECTVCGRELPEGLPKHVTRCDDCDSLKPLQRIEFSIRTKQTKFLALIAQELKYIRNRLPMPAGGKDDDSKEE